MTCKLKKTEHCRGTFW